MSFAVELVVRKARVGGDTNFSQILISGSRFYHVRNSLDLGSWYVLVTMIEDEVALLADIRFALRALDPWPAQWRRARLRTTPGTCSSISRLCGWENRRLVPSKAHGTP